MSGHIFLLRCEKHCQVSLLRSNKSFLDPTIFSLVCHSFFQTHRETGNSFYHSGKLKIQGALLHFSLYWNIKSIPQVINFPTRTVFCFSGRLNSSGGRCQAEPFLKRAFRRNALLHNKAELELQAACETLHSSDLWCYWLSKGEPTQNMIVSGSYQCLSYWNRTGLNARVQSPGVTSAIRFKEGVKTTGTYPIAVLQYFYSHTHFIFLQSTLRQRTSKKSCPIILAISLRLRKMTGRKNSLLLWEFPESMVINLETTRCKGSHGSRKQRPEIDKYLLYDLT